MITFLHVLAVILMVLGIFLMLRLTPTQITTDIMDVLRPADKLRTQASDVQARRRRKGLYGELQRIRSAMADTGRAHQFPLAITGVFAFGALGLVLAIIIDNFWLAPTLIIGLGAAPILYLGSSVDYHEKIIREETALSIITNSYIRTEDIVVAVQESIDFIKPPLRYVFDRFLQDAVVMPSTKEIIIRLRDRLPDQVFYEWCTTLLQCQDDRTLKENLNPVVTKLTDIRLINTQVAAIIASAKTEYWMMVGFMIVSIPLLAVLSPGSIDIILYSPIGKFLVGVVAAIVLFTFFRMRKATRTVDFDTK